MRCLTEPLDSAGMALEMFGVLGNSGSKTGQRLLGLFFLLLGGCQVLGFRLAATLAFLNHRSEYSAV